MAGYTATLVFYTYDLLSNGFLSTEPKVYIEKYEIIESNPEGADILAYRRGVEKTRNLLGIFINPVLSSVTIDELV